MLLGLVKGARGLLTALQNLSLGAPKGIAVKLHSEWRLLLPVIAFCLSAAFAISMWQQSHMASFYLVAVAIPLVPLIVMAFLKARAQSLFLILIISVLSGFGLGQLRILNVAQDFELKKTFVTVSGQLERLDRRGDASARLFIKPFDINGQTQELPKLIRVSARTQIDDQLRAGDVLQLSARLSRPRGPIVPGGYDFARAAYFSGIAFEGVAVSPVIKLNNDREEGGLALHVKRVREVIEGLIVEHIEGQPGAVAVALTVGFRNHISRETSEALRRAGLSHLLAISGLHMGLITAAGFFLFEFLFAAIPGLGLRYMPKKLAVAPTWLVALFYLLISGASTSTLRAFIMVSVALLAILANRKVLSLRSVALAALFITLLWPEATLSAGFQMSFAATAGLVAFYEVISGWLQKRTIRNHSLGLMTIIKYVAGIAVTSVVAQFAVGPFALYHFQAVSLIGVVSNVLALPVISFLIMPLLFLAVVMAPIGGIWLLSWPVELGLKFVIDVATAVAAPSYAVWETGPLNDAAFVIALVALLGMLIVRQRMINSIFLVIIILAFQIGYRPDVNFLVSENGKTVFAKQGDALLISGGRKNSFRTTVWRRYMGVDDDVAINSLKRSCVGQTCGYDIGSDNSYSLTNTQSLAGTRTACARGNMVILPRRYLRYCKGALLAVTYKQLEQQGPLAVRFDNMGQPQLEWSRQKSMTIASEN